MRWAIVVSEGGKVHAIFGCYEPVPELKGTNYHESKGNNRRNTVLLSHDWGSDSGNGEAAVKSG